MTPDELNKLRRLRDQLRALHSFIDNERQRVPHTGESAQQMIPNTLAELTRHFPEVFDFTPYRNERFDLIRVAQPIVATAIAAIESDLTAATAKAATPIRLFPFVQDAELRRIVERDDRELAQAVQSESWKTVLILTGGAIEGVLLDLLLQPDNEPRASRHRLAPRDKNQQTKPLDQWDLAHLIDVAHDLDLIKPNVKQFSHSVREYRNLVHPGLEKRSKMVVQESEARAAVNVLDMLHRDMA